jgi:hypothetical protein
MKPARWKTKNRGNLIVVTDEKNYDLKELAYQCLEIWRAFLKERGFTT